MRFGIVCRDAFALQANEQGGAVDKGEYEGGGEQQSHGGHEHYGGAMGYGHSVPMTKGGCAHQRANDVGKRVNETPRHVHPCR